jgi:hypothetical protein
VKTILVSIRVIIMASKSSECHSGIFSIVLKYAASVVEGITSLQMITVNLIVSATYFATETKE